MLLICLLVIALAVFLFSYSGRCSRSRFGGRGGRGGRGGGRGGWRGRGWGGGWRGGYGGWGGWRGWPWWWSDPLYYVEVPTIGDMDSLCNQACFEKYKVSVDAGIEKEVARKNLMDCMGKC